MSAPPTSTSDAESAPATKGGKKKLILLALPVLLVAGLAGIWFSGVGPKLLGHKKTPPVVAVSAAAAAVPVFVEIPDIIANLSSPPHHQSFIKLKVKIELSKSTDQPVFTSAMPRILDMFQTYLRDMRPEELRGSAGTYRLREELIARANIAASPAQVTDVLFIEMLVQ